MGYNGEEVPHAYRLYSLEKYFVNESAPTRIFLNAVKTPKLDGANVSALYVSGQLQRVLTRGDGVKGKNITNKFLHESCFFIPKQIDYKGVMQVTFEVVASKEIPNSRNYCAGSLNLKSVEEFLARELVFIAHTLQGEVTTTTFTGDMALLDSLGFRVITDARIRFDHFPQDGEVVREDNNKLFEEWGYTNHHPRGAYALKTRKEGVETYLRSVEWQVGKSGKVTPLAVFDPVEIDGAIITRATLHNIAFIEALDLDINCKIKVARMGDIIPGILERVYD